MILSTASMAQEIALNRLCEQPPPSGGLGNLGRITARLSLSEGSLMFNTGIMPRFGPLMNPHMSVMMSSSCDPMSSIQSSSSLVLGFVVKTGIGQGWMVVVTGTALDV